MKKILMVTIMALMGVAFAGEKDKCPRFLKVQKITIERYNPDDWNPKPIGDTGVIKSQRLFAEFLEGTAGVKLKLKEKNNEICNYRAVGKEDSSFSKITLKLESKKNKISYLVILKRPTQDGWNALIQEVEFIGKYELKKKVLTVLKESVGYTRYSGVQWWGTNYAIFEGVNEAKFKIHRDLFF